MSHSTNLSTKHSTATDYVKMCQYQLPTTPTLLQEAISRPVLPPKFKVKRHENKTVTGAQQ
jgi:hypothetical protein